MIHWTVADPEPWLLLALLVLLILVRVIERWDRRG